MKPQEGASVAPEEIARFSAQADAWWNPHGPFRALHELAPLRLAYIRDVLAAHGPKRRSSSPFEGLTLLDLGCGGGLMSEALAAQGANVTGLDAAPRAIEIARAHAAQSGLSIDYRVGTPESLAAEGAGFDVVLALEIVEHVRDLKSFMQAACKLVKPDGLLIIATMNRTHRSFLLGVVMAEYVLGWVESGTHDWDKFVKPGELESYARGQGVQPVDLTGMVYKPLKKAFVLEKGNVSVNYFMTGLKKNAG